MARKYNLDEHIAEGDPLHPETHEAIAEAVNDLDDRTADIETDLSTRLSPDELSATFVRFLDENGDPLPPGSLVTITVNTTTGDIDDITFEEA